MQAFILAGGKGIRLHEITKDEIPKPMANLMGKPILQWTIENLKKNGITEIFISIGHLHEKIVDYFKDGADFGVKIQYIIEDKPLGSAGALYYVKDKLKEDFLICSGDVLFDIDIDRMFKYHKIKNSVATLLTHQNMHPYDSDLVICNDDGKIIKFDSKNNIRNYYYKNNVNAGFFIINERALSYFNELKKVSMEHDFISFLIESNQKVYAYKSTEYIKDIGTVERFKIAEKDILNGLVEKKCLKNKQKAIFLDRDGVINKYKGFIRKVENIELEEKVIEAIKRINQSEYLAIVVSNQPVIARGECTFEQVDEMFNKIETLLGKEGAYLDGIYYCPHHPHSGYEGEIKELKIKCNCRKPSIGMLEKAVEDFNLKLSDCIIIGDSDLDIQTGINAGIKQIKVKSNICEMEKIKPTAYAENLFEAINLFFEKGI